MKLNSYIEENSELIRVEVELELWPGLPEIHFLGRADAHLKESAKRIKSAIRAQGFEYPVAQQILVNLRPSHLKKSSRGLEFAVAIAFLFESGQIPKPKNSDELAYFGELSLTGEVSVPSDVSYMLVSGTHKIVTGQSAEAIPFDHFLVRKLSDLARPEWVPGKFLEKNWSPPEEILNLTIPKARARMLAALALGGHSVLFAGAAGSGKTTSAKILHALLPKPSQAEVKELLRQTPLAAEILWRPFVAPHHRIPLYSLIGGGSVAHGGELARSHRGIFLMDEFLEFPPLHLEALREPFEQKKMRVSRGPRVVDYPVQAQFVATTNLCPCGEFTPGNGCRTRCRFSLKKCRSYGERFSGPLLDRFEAIAFFDSSDRTVRRSSSAQPELLDQNSGMQSVRTLREKVQEATDRKAVDGQPEWILSEDLSADELRLLGGSERRRNAVRRLAQSFSLLDGNSRPSRKNLNEAIHLASENFKKLQRWDLESVVHGPLI